MNQPPAPLLEIRDFKLHLASDRGAVKAVDGVSLTVMENERVALVGESGAGKSVTARSILRLIPESSVVHQSGLVNYQDHSILNMTSRELQQLRGREIGMIFQDPMSYMNPTKRLSEHFAEAVRRSTGRTALAGDPEACLAAVGLDAKGISHRYPHELSGGMRQRALIALALCCGPKMLIADEPTTAVDVTIQAQILNTLRDLTEAHGISLLLITHDLGVVASLCQRINVMYAGQIVEAADVPAFYANPKHPYSKGLLRSVPRIGDAKGNIGAIPGYVPDLSEELHGCRFRDRCEARFEVCDEDPPVIRSGNADVRCWLYDPSTSSLPRGDDGAHSRAANE